ncbi:MAG: hypothetical protein M1336_07025 [Deltaproteobacteria bacterium]|jgi:hypothetical protein|nr:hypothetical protein [Deltaproteobacteria bacterium]
MASVPKDQFFLYFRQRLENLKQLGGVQPAQRLNPAASFEPEQNILAGAEIDALAGYWAAHEKRCFKSSACRMAEFLATHARPEIWNRCSHTDLLERAASLAPEALQRLQAVLTQTSGPDKAMPERILSWQDDPDFATLTRNAALQAAGVPEKFLANSRYGAILYRHYRCA